jgi:membrane protein YdbS with pleckstrin-like domain
MWGLLQNRRLQFLWIAVMCGCMLFSGGFSPSDTNAHPHLLFATNCAAAVCLLMAISTVVVAILLWRRRVWLFHRKQ